MGDAFGTAVALHRDTLVVGSPGREVTNPRNHKGCNVKFVNQHEINLTMQ